MKKSELPIIGIVICLLMLCGAVQSEPMLVLDETEFDFGYVPQNSKVSHVYWLKSGGDELLKIIKVKPRCGCTKAPLDKTEVVPGDSARLELIFNTGKNKTRVSKTARIETNQGSQHRDVRFNAHVYPDEFSTTPIVIQPGKLDIKLNDKNVGKQINFDIANVSEIELEIKLIDWPRDHFEIKLPGTIKPGKTATGTLKINPDAASKPFVKSFTLELNDEEKSRFTVPVKGNGQVLGKR
jgi:hypothetical protein